MHWLLFIVFCSVLTHRTLRWLNPPLQGLEQGDQLPAFHRLLDSGQGVVLHVLDEAGLGVRILEQISSASLVVRKGALLVMHVTVRVCVPPPHDDEQLLQLFTDQKTSSSQSGTSHSFSDSGRGGEQACGDSTEPSGPTHTTARL